MLQNKVLEYNLYLAGLVFAAVSVLGIAQDKRMSE